MFELKNSGCYKITNEMNILLMRQNKRQWGRRGNLEMKSQRKIIWRKNNLIEAKKGGG